MNRDLINEEFKIDINHCYSNTTNMNYNTQKFSKDKFTLEYILSNKTFVDDLLINRNSPYKELIYFENILTLIRICLYPNKTMDKHSQEEKKKAYHSSLILCSDNVLHFKISLKNIIAAKNSKNNENPFFQNDKEKNEDFFEIPVKDDCAPDENPDNFFQKESVEEKYVNNLEIKIKDSKNNYEKIEEEKYNDIEKSLIGKILDEIFKVLDSCNGQTSFGYFPTIVNYLLNKEQNITIEYLFSPNTLIVDKLYQFLDNDSIKNIFENILNVLSDKGKETDSKYYREIMNKLFQQLFEFEEVKTERFEIICDLIIKTLLTNSDEQFIDIIFNSNATDDTMRKIINLIQKIINQKKSDKMIISLIKLILKINNIIIPLFDNSKNTENDALLSEDNKYDYFEYKYFCKKNIRLNSILEVFKKKGRSYLDKMNEMFNVISEDIKNNDINNLFATQSDLRKIKFTLKNIYEWKLILSILKLYIYSLDYKNDLIDENKRIKYFYDEDLFLISINLYFNFSINNIYQNIFLQIIKLLNDEKCPDYLIKPFLLLKEKEEHNAFISKIINNLKSIKENKNNKLLIGCNIEILRLFYFSKNKTIINYINNNKMNKIFKDNFINCINQKFERNLLDEYVYLDSEIFNSFNENEDTFDGNDSINMSRNIFPIKSLINNFFDKCEEEEKNRFNDL